MVRQATRAAVGRQGRVLPSASRRPVARVASEHLLIKITSRTVYALGGPAKFRTTLRLATRVHPDSTQALTQTTE